MVLGRVVNGSPTSDRYLYAKSQTGLLVFRRPQNSDFKKVEGETVGFGIVVLGPYDFKKVEGGR